VRASSPGPPHRRIAQDQVDVHRCAFFAARIIRSRRLLAGASLFLQHRLDGTAHPAANAILDRVDPIIEKQILIVTVRNLSPATQQSYLSAVKEAAVAVSSIIRRRRGLISAIGKTSCLKDWASNPRSSQTGGGLRHLPSTAAASTAERKLRLRPV
jgi:hypothetical protein